MMSYALFIKTCVKAGEKESYKWDPDSFTPNYYLLNLIRR